MKAPGSDLSEWAQRCYGQPGVAPALLALQDEGGQDVLLLLVITWLWAQGKHVPSQHLPRLLDQQRPWQQQVVSPLRDVRRRLKQHADAHRLYKQVKEVELAAELLQLGRLQVWVLEMSAAEAGSLLEQLRALCAAQLSIESEHLQVLLQDYAAAVETAAQAGFS
ncbi:MAG: TIGR02444 family protein [Halopseudomonas sp.]|uniref:TIGR02444 family protein n=1 Tax=Halopseudomonas sp. TaxID=2901191 RepID=UPI0030030887